MTSNNQLVLVEDRFKKMTEIHPFAQLLNRDDLDDCDWLEHAAFDPIEAASREKVSMRKILHLHTTSSHSVSSHIYFAYLMLYHNWAAVRRCNYAPSP
jgi:hypothetical protein